MPHTFKDNAGREWSLSISVGTVKRVHALVGVDIGKLVGGELKPLNELLQDPAKLVDVVFAIAKPDADKLGVTDVQFGEAMAGDSLGAAATAFLGALVEFQPTTEGRNLLAGIFAQGQRFQREAATATLQRLSQIDVGEEVRKLVSDPGPPEAGD